MDIGLDRAWLNIPCPACTYEIEFTYLQARLQESVICPCCKRNIQLVDKTASVEVSKRRIDEAMAEFEHAINAFNRTLRIQF